MFVISCWEYEMHLMFDLVYDRLGLTNGVARVWLDQARAELKPVF